MSVVIKSPDEIAIMREAGRLNAEVRRLLVDAIAPGVSGRELDELAKAEIAKRDAEPTFVGYGPAGRPPYPGAICYSVNAQLVHGIPGDLTLQEGDIVSIDLGVTYRGYVSDAAFTAAVGDVAPEVLLLLERTEAAVHAGIEQAHAGKHLGDVSHAIGAVGEAGATASSANTEGTAWAVRCTSRRTSPTSDGPASATSSSPGMVLALEPMFALGAEETEEAADRWTVRMRDGSLCAHFEETIAVTEGAPEILTDMSPARRAGGGRCGALGRGPRGRARLMAKGRGNKQQQRQPPQRKKKEVIEVEGVVKDALPNAQFDVELANEHHVLAHVSGRMKMHYIRILLGDRVLVELSPYDLKRGRITYRFR